MQQKLQSIFKLGVKSTTSYNRSRNEELKDESGSDSGDDTQRRGMSDKAQRALALMEVGLLKQIQQQCGEAEPIRQLAHKYAEGSDSPAWKKRAFNH